MQTRKRENKLVANLQSFCELTIARFRRDLGCGAVAAKIRANVWKILQLSTLVTPQLHVRCIIAELLALKVEQYPIHLL